MAIYRYSRWDGSQDVTLSTTDDLFDRLSEQILQGDDLRGALNRMMRYGMRGEGQRGQGLQELLERLRDARQRNLDRYDLSSIFDDIQERLDAIVDKERQGINQRLDEITPPNEGAQGEDGQDGEGQGGEGQGQPGGSGAPPDEFTDMLRQMANRHLNQLNALPQGAGGRIKQLRDYDFMDSGAREDFDALMQELQQQFLQQYFQGLQQSLQNLTQADLAQISEMVRDLNELVKQKLQGDDPDIGDFMNKWGHMFPPGIET
ncbi:MAG: VWA domain-containing protein, partial [Chloroflexi bacterium]|nr:VWA domain-containing protein [Chloroflexota bacterium]